MQSQFEFPGTLRRLLELPNLTDLLLLGANASFLDVGRGLEKTANPFDSEDELANCIRELAYEAGARIDFAEPVTDFMIENFRFHAILQSSVAQQNQLCVRKHPTGTVKLSHLEEVGMLTSEQNQFLKNAVLANQNFLIFGSTGSGKTTLLNAMLQETSQRIIAIEQISELKLNPPSVTLSERRANIEGAGKISTQQLLVEALRMRPDRVVVGEVRGNELVSLLQAMNNGHRGSGATVHADSFEQIPNRLILLGSLAGLTKELTATLCAGAVDLVIQLEKNPTRKIANLGRLKIRSGELAVVPLEFGPNLV